MGWKTYALGDVLKRRRDTVKLVPDHDYKLVTIRLYHKGVTLRSIVKGRDLKSTMSVVRKGDFILSGIDARNGAFGIVPEDLDGALITNDFWCLDPEENLINREFLLFLTTTSFFDHICKQSSDGTTQRIRLQKDKFLSYKLALPEVVDQLVLVEKLKQIQQHNSELSSELQTQLTLVKQLRQAFLREAMEGKLCDNTATEETGQQLLEKIKAEKEVLVKEKKIKKEKPLPPINQEEIPFEIPKNWVWCRLGEIASFFLGGFAFDSGRYSKGETINQVIRLGNVKPDFLSLSSNPIYIDNEYARETESVLLKAGDILITMTGTRAKRDYLFSLNVKEENLISKRLYLNQRVACLRFSSLISNLYLNLSLKDLRLLAPIFESATGAANQANVGSYALKQMLIPLPPLAIQQHIVEKVTSLYRICIKLKCSIKESQQQNEQLLQQILKEALTTKEAVEV